MQPTLSSSPFFFAHTQLLSPAHHSIKYPPKKEITTAVSSSERGGTDTYLWAETSR